MSENPTGKAGMSEFHEYAVWQVRFTGDITVDVAARTSIEAIEEAVRLKPEYFDVKGCEYLIGIDRLVYKPK